MQNNSRSAAKIAASMLIYGSVGVFRRYIALPSGMLACIRGFVGALFLLALGFIKRTKPASFKGKTLGLLVLSGALMGFNWILLFEAYNKTTVQTATLCYYMQPTILILLSPLVFGERLTVKKLACALVALFGMVLVSGAESSGSLIGIALGLGAAVLYAAVTVINKKLPGLEVYQKTSVQLLSAAVAILPYVLLCESAEGVAINARLGIFTAIVCIVHTGLAYALWFGGLDGVKGQTAALLGYIDPIFALILSALLLGEKLTVSGALGACLILGAAMVSELNIKIKKTEPK